MYTKYIDFINEAKNNKPQWWDDLLYLSINEDTKKYLKNGLFKYNNHKLNDYECAIISYYTTSKYYLINQYLEYNKIVERESKDFIMKYVEIFDYCLSKVGLKRYKELYKGVSENFVQTYKLDEIGNNIKIKRYISTTQESEYTLSFPYTKNNDNLHFATLVFQNISGYDIANISNIQDEAEVIIPRNKEFIVKDILTTEKYNDLNIEDKIIILQEKW